MDLDRVYRAEYGRCVATLTRLLGDIGLAEEAVRDAFATAVQKWDRPPPNPGAWIVTTARNRAIDRMRRESTREARHAQALLLHQPDEAKEVGPVRDDQLRMIFTCCHPALSPLARTALTLRLLGGLEVARHWGAMAADPGGNPIAIALNTKPKYVASTTLTEATWPDTTILSTDLIANLKARPGGELQVHGSGTLLRWLLANELVDEMNLLISPVILGQGTRLFPDIGRDMALDLVESRSTPKGITIQTYRPSGRPQYARADA
ncbi:dihydrofolate reductase family protein [Nonomuraea sp. NPDC059023]|uniref:dihydrofolate reductase family protein n=1 Tax=unclassified Nonomuraea TaxID=2593643 RepID=UPI0036A3A282